MRRPADTVRARAEVYAGLASGELSLGQACRRLRRIVGLTQDAYAALAQVAPRLLKDLEAGRGNPTLASLEKIGRPFGLEVAFRPRRSD